MKDKLNGTIERILYERQTRRRYAAILLVLAFITVLGVNWSLHQQGLSMTADGTQATAETAIDDTAGQGSEAAPATLELGDGEYTVAVQADENEADMSSYLTSMTGSGTKYDANGNLYKTDLKIEFSIPADTVRNNKDYCYTYPEGIIVPDGLLDKTYELYDGDNNKAGTYYFTQNADGTYSVHVDFKNDYNPTKDPVTGYIEFSGEVDGSKGNDDGSISIKGNDKVTLDIPADKIDYPDGETNRYEIKTSKTGSYSSKDGKLTYTVYVYSLKGTPGDINFEDTIKATGLTLDDPTVKVEKETVTRYYNPDNGGYNPNGDSFTSEEIKQDYTYDSADGKLSMTLPKIDKAEHYEATETEWEKDVYTRYKVTYTFDADASDLGDNAFVDNKVSTVSSDNNTTVKAEADKHVDLKTTVDDNVTKSGVGGGGVDYISWTITVNKNQDDIVDATLSDEMLKKLIPGHFTVNPDKGYTLVKDSDGNIIGMDFTATDDNGENRNTYTITYRTPAQADWNGGEASPVTNKVDFSHGGNTDSATGQVDSITPARVDKTVGNATENEDGKTVTVEWTVKITVPADSLPAGTVITDDPTKDINNSAGGKQYRTRDQVIEWADGIYWASYGHDGPEEIKDPNNTLPSLTDSNVATITFKGSDGKDYTLEQIRSSEIEDSDGNLLTYTVATITLKQDLITPANATYLMFHYTTTADITDASTSGTNYYNTVSVDKIKGGDTYKYTKSGITKTDENNVAETTQKTNDDGTLTWKIKVTLGKTANKLNITDTLPDGVTLVSIAGEDKLLSNGAALTPAGDGKITGSLGNGTVNGTYKDGVLNIDVTGNNLAAGVYTLVVNCKVDMDATDYVAGKTYTFTNNATAKADDADIGSADQTQEWTEDTEHSNAKVVDKSGNWDNNSRRVKYSIKLNPYGKDIVEGSETLTLKDVFEYYPQISAHPQGDYSGNKTQQYDLNAWLVPDSVKLYKGIPDGKGGLTKGELITNWTWTVTTGVSSKGDGKKTSTLLGKDLPDSTPLILEYDYQLESQIPKDYESDAGNYKVSNSAELDGTGYKDSQTGNEVKWDKQETTGAVTSDIAGTLYKVSKGRYGKTLPGAKFKLQKYNTTTSAYEDVDGVTYTTDESGRITIQRQKNDTDVKYEYNVLYRVVETDPPEGYLMPANPEANAFYFYFSSTDDTTNTLPTDRPADAADLAAASKTVYVENESSTTELTINKKWLDVNGNVDASHTSGSVKVQLYQVAGKASTGGGTGTLSGEIMATGWGDVYVWKNAVIETKEYPVGTKISFTIVANAGAPEIKVNNAPLTPEVTEVGWGSYSYTYTFTLNSGGNVISGTIPDNWANEFSGITAVEPSVTPRRRRHGAPHGNPLRRPD